MDRPDLSNKVRVKVPSHSVISMPSRTEKELLARIASLEAERDKAVELLNRWESVYGKCSALSDDTRAFLASIGGEVKNG